MQETKATIAVLIAATLAGASGVFVKYMSMPATSMSAIRTGLPVFLLGAYLLFQRKPILRQGYSSLLLASLINALRMYLFFVAFIYASIANVVLILYTWPISVTLFSVVFLKEQVSRKTIGLLGLAFIGIIIVFSNKEFNFENNDFIGMLATLGSATLYAITVVIFKKESASYSPAEIIFYQNLLGALIFIVLFSLYDPWPSQQDILLGSTHAIILGMVGFLFFFFALKHLPASKVSLLAYVEIVSALCFSVFLMKEPLTPNMILGGSMIIGATLLLPKK